MHTSFVTRSDGVSGAWHRGSKFADSVPGRQNPLITELLYT